MRARRVGLVDLSLTLVGQQSLADLAIQSFELLLARRADGPGLARGKGRRREEGRGRRQDVQAQAGEIESVRIEIEESGAGCFCAVHMSAGVLVLDNVHGQCLLTQRT